ncbi:MAG: APC family permease [Sporolactobacillus sp.]
MATQLSRTLSVKDLTMYGIVFMIPVAPIAWYGSFLAPSAGMVALAYLIGMVAMLFTGFSYMYMSQEYPISGSVYSYVQQGAHTDLGFLAGWSITLDYIFIPAVCYLVGAMFAAELTPKIPLWAWVVFFAIVNTIINALGVKIMSRLSWIIFALQILVLAIFTIGVLIQLTSGQMHFTTISLYNPSHFDLQGVLQATGIVVVSYLGFDAISTLAEEAKEPRKSVGKAIVLSIFLIGAMFFIVSFFAGVAFPDYAKLNSDTAFLDILRKVGGTWLVNLSIVTIVLSFGFACGQEGQAAIARLLYCMGRDGIMPKPLAYVHPKFKTPFIATIVIGVISVIIALALGLNIVSILISFGALLGFMALNLTVIWHFYIKESRRGGVNLIKYVIFPLIGFAVCAWIFSGLGLLAHIVGFSWMGAGLIYLLIKTKGFKQEAPHIDFGEQQAIE